MKSIARHLPAGGRLSLQTQLQPLRGSRGGKSRPDRFEQLRGAERHAADLGFVDVEPVEIQQAVDQRQQMFRRLLHVVQIKFLPFVVRQPRKQIDIAHHRPQRSLDVVRNSQHQLFARLQQRLLVAVGLLQFPAVAVTAVDVAPEHPDEQEHQHHGPDGHAAQNARRPPAEHLVALDALHQVSRILGFEIHDQAVYLRVYQFVAVTQPQSLLPHLVVETLPVARNAVLQCPQHQCDSILHRLCGHDRADLLTARNDDARIGGLNRSPSR